MREIVYLVIADCCNDTQRYIIDSIWKSERKANKQRDKLNEVGTEYLFEEYGLYPYEVIPKHIQK